MNATGFISLPGLAAEVRADTTGFIEHLGILFALSEPCRASITYVIESTSGSIVVRREDLTLYEGTLEDLALIAVYGDLYEVFVSSSRHFLIHAGCAARHGRAVVMPGAQQSGKSTLTTVLAARGWSAISDDIAVVDPANLLVFPYPRRLLIRPDTLRLNPIVAGALHILRDLEAYGELVHIACTVTPPPADAVRLAGLVFPRWSKTTTAVYPLSAAETIARVLENSLNLRFLGYEGVRLAASLTRTLPAYDLAVRDPEDAIALMSQLDVF